MLKTNIFLCVDTSECTFSHLRDFSSSSPYFMDCLASCPHAEKPTSVCWICWTRAHIYCACGLRHAGTHKHELIKMARVWWCAYWIFKPNYKLYLFKKKLSNLSNLIIVVGKGEGGGTEINPNCFCLFRSSMNSKYRLLVFAVLRCYWFLLHLVRLGR